MRCLVERPRGPHPAFGQQADRVIGKPNFRNGSEADPSNVHRDVRLVPIAEIAPTTYWIVGRLKFDGRRECRDVTFEPILCVELLIVTKIEKHGSVHQHRVVNEMRAYAKNTALEWTKLGT